MIKLVPSLQEMQDMSKDTYIGITLLERSVNEKAEDTQRLVVTFSAIMNQKKLSYKKAAKDISTKAADNRWQALQRADGIIIPLP